MIAAYWVQEALKIQKEVLWFIFLTLKTIEVAVGYLEIIWNTEVE